MAKLTGDYHTYRVDFVDRSYERVRAKTRKEAIVRARRMRRRRVTVRWAHQVD
jgi:hypothetical protein